MAPVGSSCFTVAAGPAASRGVSGKGYVVVWLRGEHDAWTDGALSLTLARAIALDSAGLILDLHDVDFIGASTLGTIMRAREFLRQRSASLTLRSPSPIALRLLQLCGLTDLLNSNAEMTGDVTEPPGSWAGAPAGQRSATQPRSVPRVLDRTRALVGRPSGPESPGQAAEDLAETA